MNPPIRSAADREALIRGLLDGTIDCIATDHAPHSAQEKAGGLRGSLNGIVGLECAFAVLYTQLVQTGIVPLEVLLNALCVNPRRIFALPGGEIAPGAPARSHRAGPGPAPPHRQRRLPISGTGHPLRRLGRLRRRRHDPLPRRDRLLESARTGGAMKQSLFTMEHARQLTGDTYELILSGDTSAITAPGQFVNIQLPGKFLRRPISICSWSENALMLLVKVVGEGTRELVRCVPGTQLDVLSGLGNGFDLSLAGEHPVLAGGGHRHRAAVRSGPPNAGSRAAPYHRPGLSHREGRLLPGGVRRPGLRLLIATEDGSLGMKGFVTDCIQNVPECSYALCCGPLPMLKAVHALPQLKGGQFSFEARMGCGFGACMGCTVPTVNGYKRVCKDGPILYKEEIVW